MRLLHNGNVGIATTAPQTRLHVAGGTDAALGGGGYALLGDLAGLNVVLDNNEIMARSNGTTAALTLNNDGGNVHIGANGVSRLGIGTATPTAGLHLDDDLGLLAVGTFGSGAIPVQGGGTRMMWYPRRAAFRAGWVSLAEWNDTNVGDYSVAFGQATIASGVHSAAMGQSTTASGAWSLAGGYDTDATGPGSTALGVNTVASGDQSLALGAGAVSSGAASAALGVETRAQSYAGTALGRWNVGGGSATTWVATDPVLEVGIGTSNVSRFNALTVLKNGNATFSGSVTAAGGSSASLGGGGYAVLGSTTSQSLALDTNDIMARNNGAAAALTLNALGGAVRIASGSGQLSLSSGLIGCGDALTIDAGVDGTFSAGGDLTLSAGGSLVLDGPAGVDVASSLGVGGPASLTYPLLVHGDAAKPGGGSWASSSDARLKKDVLDLDGALERLLALRGVTFEYIDPEAIGEPAGERIGFLAQEVEQVFPDWVGEKEDGMKFVSISGFEALAVEALRELHGASESLRARDDAQTSALREQDEAQTSALHALALAKDAELAVLRAQGEAQAAELAALRAQSGAQAAELATLSAELGELRLLVQVLAPRPGLEEGR